MLLFFRRKKNLSLSFLSFSPLKKDSASLHRVVVHQAHDVPQLRDPSQQRLGRGVELRSLRPDGAVGPLLQGSDFLLEHGDLLEDLLGLLLAQLGFDDLLVLGNDLQKRRGEGRGEGGGGWKDERKKRKEGEQKRRCFRSRRRRQLRKPFLLLQKDSPARGFRSPLRRGPGCRPGSARGPGG